MKVDIVPVDENFRGLSYGQWASIWCGWLMSEDPDNTVRKDILFLRGNLDYSPVTSSSDFPRFSDPSSTLIKIGQNMEMIFENTALFIPALTAQYSIGDIYDGMKLKSEQDLREAVNKDTDESLRVWATITYKKKTSKIVDDLTKYRVESPLFQLSVPVNGKLRLKTQYVVLPGKYYTVVGGFFLLIRSLPKGRYRLDFGGNGRGNYSTNSVYEIAVEGLRDNIVLDKTTEVIRNKRKDLHVASD